MIWEEIPPATAQLIGAAGIDRNSFAGWKQQWRRAVHARLQQGTAEHTGYFILQSKLLGDPPLRPDAASAEFIVSLSPRNRRAFLSGTTVDAPLADGVRKRMSRFWEGESTGDRHLLLRRMADSLGPSWSRERIVQQALRFAAQRSRTDDVDALFQQRGLSGDPYPPSMLAVGAGLSWLRTNGYPAPATVALIGPGIELGSRFGVDDGQPLRSPQPAALRRLTNQARMTCVDIRPEALEVLNPEDCSPVAGDVVLDGWPRADLVVATNVLVYLDDVALTVAFANLARNISAGGCLIHNDARFAARAAGAAAGLPVVYFAPVSLGTRGKTEQFDRAVIHCKSR